MMAPLPAFFFDDRRHCKGSTLMWPNGEGDSVAVAIAVCRPPGKKPCPFLDECLAYALAKGEDLGVWGGRSMRARKRARNAAGHGTNAGYNRHRRLGEEACDACRVAHNQWIADYRVENLCRDVRGYPTANAVPRRTNTTPYECHHCGQWHATTKERAA